MEYNAIEVWQEKKRKKLGKVDNNNSDDIEENILNRSSKMEKENLS